MTTNEILQLLKVKINEINDIQEVLFVNKESESSPNMIIQWENENLEDNENFFSEISWYYKLILRTDFTNTENDVLYFNDLVNEVKEKISKNKTLDWKVTNIELQNIITDNSDEWSSKRIVTFNLEIKYDIQNVY